MLRTLWDTISTKITTTLVVAIDFCRRKAFQSRLRLLSVLGTVYKLHPTDWWRRLHHGIVSGKKSPQIITNKCSDSDAVVLGNGRLLSPTGDILICCIIVKQDAINGLKYSPKNNNNTFSHSDCCSNCQCWAVTYYMWLFTDKPKSLMSRPEWQCTFLCPLIY